jgi:hypothetical protein
MSAQSKQRWPRVGEEIIIDYGPDPSGRWCWKCEWYDPKNMYGPFATKDAAEKHSQVTVFGSECRVEWGGQWDPAWDRPQ